MCDNVLMLGLVGAGGCWSICKLQRPAAAEGIVAYHAGSELVEGQFHFSYGEEWRTNSNKEPG